MLLVVLIVFCAGLYFISARWSIVREIRRELMITDIPAYLALPSPKKMFWSLSRWTVADFTKGRK